MTNLHTPENCYMTLFRLLIKEHFRLNTYTQTQIIKQINLKMRSRTMSDQIQIGLHFLNNNNKMEKYVFSNIRQLEGPDRDPSTSAQVQFPEFGTRRRKQKHGKSIEFRRQSLEFENAKLAGSSEKQTKAERHMQKKMGGQNSMQIPLQDVIEY